MQKEDTSLPTVAVESFFISANLDACESEMLQLLISRCFFARLI